MPRRPLAAALLAATLLGCSSGSGRDAADPDPAPAGSGTPSASVTASPGASPSGTAPASTPASPGGSIATASGGPGTAPPAGGGSPPAGTRLTATGRYAYTQQGSETFGGTTREYPPSLTVTVRAGLTADSRVFDVPYSPDRGDALTLRYAGGRIEIVRADTYVRSGAFEQRRSLVPEPPIPAYPAGARAGDRAAGRFTSPEASGRWVLEVVRREQLRVGGRPVDTVVVDLGVFLESGRVTGSIRSTTYWDPSRALPVRQRTDTDLRDAVATYASSVTIMLARLP